MNTSPRGLAIAAAAQRLVEQGKNEIEGAKKKTVVQLLLHQAHFDKREMATFVKAIQRSNIPWLNWPRNLFFILFKIFQKI